jgi:hypothetical protein
VTGVETRVWDNGLVEDHIAAGGGVASAVFSPDRSYRYLLRRTWQPEVESLLFVMLNPSTADALTDDHTIRRCRHYARRHNYGGVSVANLFALRATDPKALLAADDPSGPANWQILTTLALRDPGRLIIAAWGEYDRRLGVFGEQATELFTERGHTLHRLGPPTVGGHPRHPARLANDAPLEVHAPGRAVIQPDPLAPLLAPGLHPCHAAGMCPRLVTSGSRYCCAACGDAWEATPRHEPHAHSEGCDARWAERKDLVRHG